MKTKLALVLCVILIAHLSVKSQVKIGANATTINSASLLELETTNKGFVLPRVSITDVSTSTPLNAGLLTGTVVYNTNSSTTGGAGTGIYYWDGTQWNFLANSTITGNYWSLTGNSGTSAFTNFIGTSDAVDFVARTNNAERLRITSGGNVGIGIANPSYKLAVLSSSNPLYLSGVQATSTFSSDSVLTINGGIVKKTPYSSLTGSFWSLTGNSGTNYATNFLGTTDNVSLRFRTNNTEQMIIDSMGHVGIGSSTFNALNPAKLLVDYGTTISNTIVNLRGSTDNYFQMNLQNKSNSIYASTDYVATSDDGTDSTYYVDLGINSSTYSPSVDNFGGKHDAYLYASSRNLLIGTAATNSDVIFLLAGGRTKYNTAMRMDATNGNIIVGTGDNNDNATGNTIRGPNGKGTNIAGGNLTLQGGSSTGTATGGSVNIYGGSPVSGTAGAVNINSSINSATNINTGTSASDVTIGNALNNINLPKLSATSVVLTDASKNLTSTTPSSNTYLYYNGTNFIWATASSTMASLTNGGGIASLNYNGSSPATVSLANGTAAGQVYVTGATPFTPSLVTMSGDATINSAGGLTLASVNSNIGTFNNVTVNAKGLVTAASNVAYTTLGSFSTIAPLTYNNLTGVFGITKANATTDGYLSSTDWNTFNNKVGSITLNTPSSVFSNPINFSVSAGTATGTLSLNTQTANTIFAGPASGIAATPTFRALVAADIPSLAGSYIQNQTTQQASSNFNISGTGTVGGLLTSSGGHTNSGALTTSGGIVNVNASSNFATNINTGTSTGNITIGNSSNNILLPQLNTAGGMIYTSVATGQIASTGSNMKWDDVNNRLGIGLTNPSYKLSVLAASDPLYLSGVQATTTFSTDSLLTINAGVVKKSPYSSLTGANNWSLTGNSGTTTGTNFLGTTDGNALTFKVNNTAAGYLGLSGSSYATSLGVGSSGASTAFKSTAIGAGAQATGSNSSLAVGYLATASTQNAIAIGTSSVAGGNNEAIAIGYSSNATSFQGIAMGSNAVALTSNQAIAIGTNSTASGFQSIAIGYSANATTNNSALAIGVNASATGYQSTAIGNGTSATAQNSTAIGNGATTSTANTLILGNSANVGIGTSTPGSSLDVKGTLRLSGSSSGYVGFQPASSAGSTTYTLPTADGTSGQFLSTNGSGTLSWGTTLTSSTGWTTTGNSGTTAGTNFLGTTDANDLVIKTNNTEEMRVKSGGGVAINVAALNTNNILAIKDGHIQLQQTTAPTITAGATTVIGSTGTVSLSNATDNAGKITITTSGTSPSAAGTICTITFNRAFNSVNTPILMLTATNANGATALFNDQIYVTATSSNSFTLSCVVKLQNSLSCNFNYMVVESQ